MQNIYAIRHYIEQLSNANLANSKVVVLESNIATDGKTGYARLIYVLPDVEGTEAPTMYLLRSYSTNCVNVILPYKVKQVGVILNYEIV